VNFQDIQKQLQKTVGDTSAATLVHIKHAINLAYREMCAMSPNYWERNEKELTVEEGTAAYDLDATCRKVLRLRPPVDVAGIIRIVDNDAWNEIITDWDATGSPVMARVIDRGAGNEMKIEMHPIPEAADAGTYKYDGEFLPADLSADDDEPIFGPQWDACLLDMARCALFKIQGASEEKIAAAQTVYQERLARFAATAQAGSDLKGA